MRTFAGAIIALLIIGATASAQFKTKPESTPAVTESMIRSDDSGLLFGWIDPGRLTFHNSYSLSYTTSGGKGFSLGTLTSSVGYQISDPLSVQFDVSLLHSPFGNTGGNFANSISGIYLTRAELNYRPSKNTLLQVQFRQLPTLYWLNDFDRYGFGSWVDPMESESH
jgi:hypothetical protein